MDIGRLRDIIKYNDAHREDIEKKVKHFYGLIGMSMDKDVLNIMQIVRPSFKKKGYLVMELPFDDKEIGALCYKGDALGYVVLNTSLPKVNLNFALCHEIYHVFYQESKFRTKVEFANNHYYESEDESAANLFAGMLLMPEEGFRFMYAKFKEESGNNEWDTMIRLMNYYQAPYMAILIRCYELNLPETDNIPEEYLNVTPDSIRKRFIDLWLDTDILDASEKDDYIYVEALVEAVGEEYARDYYLSKRALTRALQNMQEIYSDIRGDAK